MKQVILVCVLALSAGCATMERHPIATAVVTGLVVGSIAASGHRNPTGPRGDLPKMCQQNMESCK